MRGPAPERRWLVREVFPMGAFSLLAAMGDTGKGMMLLDLALKVACGAPRPGLMHMPATAFGCTLAAHGAVVMLLGEDDRDEVHRRLERLAARGGGLAWWKDEARRLMIVPMPNAGGPVPLVEMDGRRAVRTADFDRLVGQLARVADLRLVVIDPLASFVQVDLDADNAAAAVVTGALAQMAAELGCAVLAAHHMSKGVRSGATTPEDARAAIRGATGLVDGSRASYALWRARAEEARPVLVRLGLPARGDAWRSQVVFGAVVKANGPSDKTVRTYVRERETGLLVDRTDELQRVRIAGAGEACEALAAAIAAAAEAGSPFTLSGRSGVWEMNHRLPAGLRGGGRGGGISKHALQMMTRALIAAGRVVQCKVGRDREARWLDVPGGRFAAGMGSFASGAVGPAADAPAYVAPDQTEFPYTVWERAFPGVPADRPGTS
jgi:hypothetical protein